jgi:hypothetical protein
VFDAKDRTRHFYISDSIVSFQGLSFTNGIGELSLDDEAAQEGSLLVLNSDVCMEYCDFQKNQAEFGGAVLSCYF